MLVLTRKPGQTIRIGPDVYVKVVDIGQGRARIGISAPEDVKIDRAENVESEYLDIPDFLRRGKD